MNEKLEILNPTCNDCGEKLYEVAIGTFCNVGLLGFHGLVYAWNEQDAVDTVIDKRTDLQLTDDQIIELKHDGLEELIAYTDGGQAWDIEDLHVLKEVANNTK